MTSYGEFLACIFLSAVLCYWEFPASEDLWSMWYDVQKIPADSPEATCCEKCRKVKSLDLLFGCFLIISSQFIHSQFIPICACANMPH